MKIAITVNRGRVAPVFPGVPLQLLDEADTSFSAVKIVDTTAWPQLAWASELMQHDVGYLFCAAIDSFTQGALQGYGIEVIPNVTGSLDEVIAQWRNGTLRIPEILSSAAYAKGGECFRRQKRNGRNR